MTNAEKIVELEAAEQAVLKAIEKIDAAWGEESDRAEQPKPHMRLAEAGSLLERAGGKIRTAINLLRRGRPATDAESKAAVERFLNERRGR
jgi:hypothetical protein